MGYANRICGIYKITNPIGQIYIGQSVHIYSRWGGYKSPSFLKGKTQKKLAKSMRVYGCDKHLFEILQICEPNELFELELKYGKIFNCLDKNYGLNGSIGEKEFSEKSEDTLKLMSELTTEQMQDPNRRNLYAKAIDQYDITGKLINTFVSVSEASLKTNQSSSQIWKVCNGKRARGNGYVFRYKGDDFNKFSIELNGVPRSTQIAMVDLITDKILIIFNNMEFASLLSGISKSKICIACKGSRPHASGYKWKYIFNN